jgi:UDP-glucose 4-epimerase
MSKQQIIITGGVGMIGKALTKILLKNYNLTVLDKKSQILRNKKYIKSFKNKGVKFYSADILKKKDIAKHFRNIKYVVHLAAMLGVNRTEKRKNNCWRANFIGTKNVVETCLSNNVERIIFSSSSEVYGEQKTNKKIKETSPLLGSNIYASSKIEAEKYIIKYLKNKKTKYTIVRLFNTYGEGQVAQFFIPKLCYAIQYNKNFTINGNGNQIRSYAYCSDVAIGIKKCLISKKAENNIYNIGNSKEVFTLKDVTNLVSKIKKKKIKISFAQNFKTGDRKKSREIFNRICDTSKAKKDLKYIPKINLKKGLKKVLKQEKIFLNWP